MHLFFLYLFKLSVSLAVMYLFYRLLLRRLTFYNHNRWYLLSYSLLCFLIPFINISPALGKNETLDHDLITIIPILENFTGDVSDTAGVAAGWTVWNWLVLLFLAGAIIMLVRLILQFVSFSRIKRKARLISDDSIRFYQVDKDIIPFSFGKSIFINQQLHTEKELKEIIRHEFVHVKQKHTIDIIWSEILCILNWYNPFAWLIRKAIRQNLEFIADNRVLANGMDKKQYQYLLLKVIGNNHFSMVNQFNFSSLKNRIVMMNKMSSAKIHLTRFLFVLPLLTVVLLSFRSVAINKSDRVESKNLTAELILPAAIDLTDVQVGGDLPLPDTTKPLKKQAPPAPPSPPSPPSPVNPAPVQSTESPQPVSPVQAPQPASPVEPLQPGSPVQAPQPATPVQPGQPKPALKIKKSTDPSGKPLVIVDGEEWPANLDLGIIDVDKIESMNVLKGESANVYGDKGKDGVILIKTKKDKAITVVGYSSKPNSTVRIRTAAGKSVNAVYIIDGKPASKEAADKLEPASIKSVNVLKDSKAEEKYGEKGKNGVIEITTTSGIQIK